MRTIVFSKNRAMQLHAFLRSYDEHVLPRGDVFVIFRSTNERHYRAYREMFEQFEGWVWPHQQGIDFKADVLALLPNAGCVIFFVDDQIFIHPWDIVEEPGLSLRLGMNLSFNYASDDAAQPLPPFETYGRDRMMWRWSEGQMAWRYPLSLDGHVFDLAEVRPMIASLTFSTPNTLEAGLQHYAPAFLTRSGTCYRQSKVVNVPWNRVQQDYANRSADPSLDTGAEDLLDYWEQGYQIDLSRIYGTENESTHQELLLELEER